MSLVKFRPMRTSDLTGVVRTFCETFDRRDHVRVRAMIVRERRQGHRYLVAESERQIVGFVSWTPRGEARHRLAELYHIGVRPKHPGTAQHLEEMMVEAIHQHFRRLGFPGARLIYLMTHTDNRLAQLFYARVGYRAMVNCCPACGRANNVNLIDYFRRGVNEVVYLRRFD